MRRAICVLLLGLGWAACRSAPASVAGAPTVPLAGLPERYQPAFRNLVAAVEEHEDALARRTLDLLRSRLLRDRERLQASRPNAPDGASESARDLAGIEAALSAARAFDRILTGRSLVDAVRLELACIALDDERGVRIVLRASAPDSGPLVLAPGPATLVVHSTRLSPMGRELHDVWSRPTDAARTIVLDGDGVAEIPLGAFPLVVPPDTLALRMRWRLELRAGEIRLADQGYPAMGIEVEPTRLERLAPFLPLAATEPAELARYVDAGAVYLPALLERTVRIAPARRQEALDLLAPLVAGAARTQLERLAPALRWLTDREDPPAGPMGWKAWFASRAREAQRGAPRPTLDLGGSATASPRAARASGEAARGAHS